MTSLTVYYTFISSHDVSSSVAQNSENGIQSPASGLKIAKNTLVSTTALVSGQSTMAAYTHTTDFLSQMDEDI